MARNQDPFAKLLEQWCDVARDRIECLEGICQSPIEQLLLNALALAGESGQTECTGILLADDDDIEARLQNEHNTSYLIVRPQKQLPDWRPDFVIHYFFYGYPNPVKEWRTLIVECDGHDFHERTKQQAARDRRRDRQSQVGDTPILRFTGSEIWADPWECALEIIEWYQKGL